MSASALALRREREGSPSRSASSMASQLKKHYCASCFFRTRVCECGGPTSPNQQRRAVREGKPSRSASRGVRPEKRSYASCSLRTRVGPRVVDAPCANETALLLTRSIRVTYRGTAATDCSADVFRDDRRPDLRLAARDGFPSRRAARSSTWCPASAGPTGISLRCGAWLQPLAKGRITRGGPTLQDTAPLISFRGVSSPSAVPASRRWHVVTA